MSEVTLYGIKNCDTVKKARKWLDQADVAYHFHDLRSDGLSERQVQGWLAAVGTDTLINKRSTTWKGLNDIEKAQALQADSATAILLNNPTLIKRPVLECNGNVHIGFKAEHYHTLF
ncbi:ArsC family reductase [Gilvimarinus sp. SDUM040013]|uniref:ArsC family reductase n=1 Tax=Gilvimarinus gilvus TaxID=3058038 RepID=A0ABU4S140_9GAMM|nr:ArsC family reductase [Gilvimarinus sp. SDUM040013]MDO3385799.1 ArsC family reductase [Gilvimarinus sp. SDUM040013]MDX6850639.1 ArsC family reductase [Gilvimarinus sp. SDUM040013]